MTTNELSELELLAGHGDWEAAQRLFAGMSLSQDGRSSAAVDELALAVFAKDADRTRAAIEKILTAETPTEPDAGRSERSSTTIR